MKIGDVIVKKGNASVITKIENNTIKETKTLGEYIMSTVAIKDDDNRFVTIMEFVNARCEEYINGVNVHEL